MVMAKKYIYMVVQALPAAGTFGVALVATLHRCSTDYTAGRWLHVLHGCSDVRKPWWLLCSCSIAIFVWRMPRIPFHYILCTQCKV